MKNSDHRHTIDLNCDMGEFPGVEGRKLDAGLMPFIRSANIACGFHAGDEVSMKETVSLAIKYGVRIGAHPSFPDRENFGRKEMALSPKEIYQTVSTQIEKLDKICKQENASLHHVKPHGALYNMAAKNLLIADSIARAVLDHDKSLILYGPSLPAGLKDMAEKHGCPFFREVFADRSYESDGALTSRMEKGSILSVEEAEKQVSHWLKTGSFITHQGSSLKMEAETICIHGDHPQALELAEKVSYLLYGSASPVNHDAF